MSFLERIANAKTKICYTEGCTEPRHWYRGSARHATYCKTCLREKRRATRVSSPRTYARGMWQNAKSRSAKKGIEFAITPDDVLNRLNYCGWRCEVTGMKVAMPEISQGTSVREAHAQKISSPSLDRIDSSRGYTVDNIRITSCGFNLMRATMDDRDLLSMCKLVVEAHNSGHFCNF